MIPTITFRQIPFAQVAYLGQEFSVADHDFTDEKINDLSRLAETQADQGRNTLAAKTQAKAAFITFTLLYAQEWAAAREARATALAAFRAEVTITTVAGFEATHGADVLEGIEGVDSVLVYPGGAWIANMGDPFNRHHYLILERDEHTTADGHLTLRDLEELLFDWAQEEAAFAAAEAEAQWPDSDPIGTADDDTALHALARAMMAVRTDLPLLSLDEWLAEHHDRLTAPERRAASAILALF